MATEYWPNASGSALTNNFTTTIYWRIAVTSSNLNTSNRTVNVTASFQLARDANTSYSSYEYGGIKSKYYVGINSAANSTNAKITNSGDNAVTGYTLPGKDAGGNLQWKTLISTDAKTINLNGNGSATVSVWAQSTGTDIMNTFGRIEPNGVYGWSRLYDMGVGGTNLVHTVRFCATDSDIEILPSRTKTYGTRFYVPSYSDGIHTFGGWKSNKNLGSFDSSLIYSKTSADSDGTEYQYDQNGGSVYLHWVPGELIGDSVILDANGGHFMNNWSEATYSTVPHDGGDSKYYTSEERGWAIRGAPYIPSHAEFMGYYDKNTFNANDIVKVYNLNESYKNVNDGNYMVVAIQNTKYFDNTSVEYSNDTHWRSTPVSQGDPAQSITINVPTWILQSSETTFYALWKIKNLNIVYKNEDGTNYNTNSLSSLQNSNSIALMPLSDAPQKTGYYFNQWKDDQNNLHAAGSTYPINTGPLIPGELTFTATFGLKKYNIVLDANGGRFIHASGTPSSVDNVYNFGDMNLSIMYRGIPKHPKGWTFLGYYNQATGEQVYKPSENITWENTQYTYTEDDYDIQDEYVYAAEPVENTRYWKTETIDVDFANAAHWKQLIPETKKMVSWNYNGTHNETIRLVARWRPKTNTYIYDPSDSEEPWKVAYIYINIAAPGEEPIWQSISAVTFL